MSEVTGMNDILPSPAIKGAKRHSRTVTVACKVDIGLKLQLQRPMTRQEAVHNGVANEHRETPYMVFHGDSYNVFGPRIPAHGGIPDGYQMPPEIRGGYALTPGIPSDFWEQWLEQNKLAPYVTNGMIFACPDISSAKAKANEQTEIKSGLEPLSRQVDERTGQLKDRRIPKPLNGSVGRVAFDADRSASE
jgi:hypothetical protein